MTINTTVRYGIDSITKAIEQGTTVGQLKGNASIRAALGCGDSLKATMNGIELPNEAVVPAGSTIVFETQCNTKAMSAGEQMVNVRYGIDSISRAFPGGVTVGQVVGNQSIKAGLGFGDSIKVTLNGIQLPMEAVVPSNATLVIETACNTKAQN